MSNPERNMSWYVLGVPVLATVLIRFFAAHVFVDSPLFWPLGGDRGLYQDMARALAEGRSWPDVLTFLPLYPWLVGGVYRVLGDSNPALIAFLQTLLDGVTAVLIARAAQRRYGSGAALLAGLGFASLGASAAYSLVTMSLSLGLFWVALCQTLADRFQDRWTLATSALMGLLLGIGGQILGSFWLMIPVFAIWIVGRALSRGRRRHPSGATGLGSGVPVPISARMGAMPPLSDEEKPQRLGDRLTLGDCLAPVGKGCALVLCGALCVLPSLAYNLAHGGQWIPVTAHGGLNVYLGNNPECKGYAVALPGIRVSAAEMTTDAVALASRQAGRALSSVEADRFWRRQVACFWRDHPLQGFRLVVGKVHRLVSIRSFDDTGLCRLLPTTVAPLKAACVGFGAVWILACAGWGWRRHSGHHASAWLMGLAFVVGLLSTFVTERYRLPIAVLLLPAAAGTLMGVGARVNAWVRQRVLKSASVLRHEGGDGFPVADNLGHPLPNRWVWIPRVLGVALIGVSVWPHEVPDTQIPDALNLSAYALRSGAAVQALARASEALALAPDAAEALFAVGNAHAALGHYPQALEAYRRVQAQQPGRVDVCYNVGYVLERMERWPEAVNPYAQAVRLNPRMAQAWLGLAIVWRRLGEPERSQEALRKTAELVGWDHPDVRKAMGR